jgi:eukaryotic-like serine/threonine-protein kinase
VADVDATLPGSESSGERASGDVGHKVGRYVLLDRLGAGAMGVVHAAYDPELDRKVALKLLLPSRQDAKGRQQLIREAKALARLSHPNVVAVHDAGTHGDRVFVTMAYVEGVSLRTWFDRIDRDQRGCWRQVLAVMLEAGKGLQAAHAAGLIHRDFKPHNVLVGNDGDVRVVDFGLAVGPEAHEGPVRDEPGATVDASDSSFDGRFVGTPGYMAPELFGGARADEQSDQFAYCVTLYEGLFGARPFPGRTVAAVACAVLEHRIRPIPEDDPVPSWLREAVLRGLSADPNERWPSMADLLDRIGRDPRSKVRRAVWAGTGLVGVAVTSLLIGERIGESSHRCSGSDEIARVWDGERRETIAAALLQTGESYASQTVSLVTDALDAYARSWIEHHDDACHAHGRGERSAATLDLQMACLARRKQRLAALVDVLARADGEVVENAAAAIDALPSVAACADLDAVREWVEPPVGHAAEEVERLANVLVRAEAEGAAGRYGEARRVLHELLPRAKAIGYEPFVAEVLLSSGLMALRDLAYADARVLLDESWRTALASAHDEVAARAIVAAIEATTRGRGEEDDIERRSMDARAMLDRLERRGAPAASSLRADLLYVRGLFARTRAENDEAIELLDRALDHYASLPDTRPLRAADILLESGNAKFQAGHDEEALESYRQAFELRREHQGESHPSVGGLHNNLGLVHKRLGRLEEAIDHLERSLVINTQKFAPSHALNIRTYRNLAHTYFEAERMEDADRTYRAGIAAIEAGEGHDATLVELLLRHARVLEMLGRLDEARDLRARALVIAKDQGEPSVMAQALWYEGNFVGREGDLGGQIVAHERALELYEEGASLYAGDVGTLHWTLAKALRQRADPEDFDRARALERQALERAERDVSAHGRRFRDEIRAWLNEHG